MESESPISTINDSIPKRRASRACVYCRSRKVRCDAMKQGMPCTNCRLDKVQCALATKKKERARAPKPTAAWNTRPKPLQKPKQERAIITAFDIASQLHTNIPPLPKFIKGISSRLKQEEIKFLHMKGAFNVPELKTLRPFIKAYIDHVHPYIPILDLQRLLSSISQNNARCPTSLFLLQAILFTSVSFVTEPLLETIGHKDRDSARRALFRRAKALYDFDVEDDSLSIVQGLLLLTFWHGTPDEPTGCWYWAGLSLTWALRMGLHHENTSADTDLDTRQRGLRRRIWWSVYIRDRLTALWMQRPARIQDNSFNIPTITTNDFDPPISSTILLRFMTDCSYLSNVGAQEKLAAVFIDLSTLCVPIGRVLAVKFSLPRALLHPYSLLPLGNKSSLDGTSSLEAQVQSCAFSLHRWLEHRQFHYPPHITPATEDIVRIPASVVQMLHSTALMNLYLSDQAELCSPKIILLGSSPQAAKVTQGMCDLSQRKLIQYLPISAVTILIPTIAVHIMEVNSPDPTTRTHGYHNLDKCLQCLWEVSRTHSAAAWANIFFEASALGSSASLPFRALERARGVQLSGQHSFNPLKWPYGGLTPEKEEELGFVDPSQLCMGDLAGASDEIDRLLSGI